MILNRNISARGSVGGYSSVESTNVRTYAIRAHVQLVVKGSLKKLPAIAGGLSFILRFHVVLNLLRVTTLANERRHAGTLRHSTTAIPIVNRVPNART